MQNPLRTSKKKIDSEIMYEMRRQGMTNNAIAKNLGVAVKTVYNHIGKMSYAVKNAEAQNKPPVVDTPVVGKPVISAENGFKPFEAKPKEETRPPVKKSFLVVLSAKYTMQGEMCQYAIDTAAGTVELLEGASMVTGMLDKGTIRRFISELEQVEEMLTKGKVIA